MHHIQGVELDTRDVQPWEIAGIKGLFGCVYNLLIQDDFICRASKI